MRQGLHLEDLDLGMSATYAKTVSEADIGCRHARHSNPSISTTIRRSTMFKGRIAHGMLTASFISTVVGTRLPGPGCVYVSQNLRFKAPVRIGDTVRAIVEVTNIDRDRARVTVSTRCLVGDKIVIDGEAVLMVPRRAELQAAE
jgi:3-hydroxybutyryl-CoA dehydratase